MTARVGPVNTEELLAYQAALVLTSSPTRRGLTAQLNDHSLRFGPTTIMAEDNLDTAENSYDSDGGAGTEFREGSEFYNPTLDLLLRNRELRGD